MKKLFLLIILHCTLYIVTCHAQQYGWVDISSNLPNFPGDTLIINNPPDTVVAGLRALNFINDDEGWISTYTFLNDSCMILHTTDGGNSWEVQPIMDYIVAIEMFDDLEGYAAARQGTIYHTVDGGETWEFHTPTFAWLSDMDFPPESDTGYACGMSSAIFRITPQGSEEMTTGTVSDLNAIHFLDRNHGWTCGESIVKEYVNGVWTGGHAYPSGFWHDIFFTDSLNGWGAGYWLISSEDTAVIIHTTNDSSWFIPQLINVGNTGSFMKVFFLNNQMGWTINVRGRIYSTIDGGNTWTREAEGMTTEFLIGIQFTSSNNGYVVGNNKTLLKFTQLTDVEEQPTQPLEFQLEQNYPNPFNPSTKISWQSPVSSHQTLKVYDVLGNEIATLVNEEKAPGTYEVMFNSESGIRHPASGVYFYQLKAGEFIQTKKMILIK